MSIPEEPRHAWIEIVIEIHPFAHESVTSFLFDLGCTGVVSQDFDDRSIKAYLPFQENLEEIRNRIEIFLQGLKEIFPEAKAPRLSVGRLKTEDWGMNWRRFFRPAQVTPELLILPEWEPLPAARQGHVIRMDPGPAFGTGQHPTTRMCLEAMERLPLPPSWTMLDVGTGSGILAMYAAKLGAERVVGIDNDPEAIRWAEHNTDLNGLSGKIELSSRPLADWGDRFSLVAANLILETIVELFPLFPKVLAPDGLLLLSGLLGSQVPGIEDEFAKNGLEKVEVLTREEWACVVVKSVSPLLWEPV